MATAHRFCATSVKDRDCAIVIFVLNFLGALKAPLVVEGNHVTWEGDPAVGKAIIVPGIRCMGG